MKIILIAAAVISALFLFTDIPYHVIAKAYYQVSDNEQIMIIHPFKKRILWYNPHNQNIKVHLLIHEEKHLKQIESEGSLKWIVKYSYYLVKYGYKNNPYEKDACKLVFSSTHSDYEESKAVNVSYSNLGTEITVSETFMREKIIPIR